MMKIQQKVSGDFRTETGAIDFCRIRSDVSTRQKNHVDLLDGITQALAGQPRLPPETPPLSQVQQSSRSAESCRLNSYD